MTNNESGMDQTRMISGAAGGALLLMGLRKRGVLGLGMAAVGGYLAYRAATGNDPVMAAAGLSGNAAAAKPIFVEHSVVIDRPAQDVYDFWRKLDNLPQIMSHLESVTALDEKRSRWVAKAPLGTHVEWEAEIVNDKPGQRIGWHSLPGATVDNAGSVQFESLPNGGTRVHVALSYRPPGRPARRGRGETVRRGTQPADRRGPPEVQGRLRRQRQELNGPAR